jgi:hypothetical protein
MAKTELQLEEQLTIGRRPRQATLPCPSSFVFSSRRPFITCYPPFSALRFCFLSSAFCCLISLAACSYHVAGRGDRLPPDIKTIAVPIFVNESPRFRIEQRLAAAVTREFIERTKFRITPNPAAADAVLRGTVKDVRSGVITFDLNTGRATSLQIQVTADVKLVDLHGNKVVFANPNYTFREQYQVSQTTSGLFEEDQPALDRLARDLARTLVTEILENF